MMHTFFLDGSVYATPRDLHAALKSMMALPDYYGMNADALHDCLGERAEQPVLCLRRGGNEAVESTLDKVCRVLEDLDGQVREL